MLVQFQHSIHRVDNQPSISQPLYIQIMIDCLKTFRYQEIRNGHKKEEMIGPNYRDWKIKKIEKLIVKFKIYEIIIN